MISNKELFSRVADVEKAKYEHQLKEPFGIWLNKIIRNNLENYGDMPWMVSTYRNYSTIIIIIILKI